MIKPTFPNSETLVHYCNTCGNRMIADEENRVMYCVYCERRDNK